MLPFFFHQIYSYFPSCTILIISCFYIRSEILAMSSRARKDLFKMVTTFSYNAVEKYVIEFKKKHMEEIKI